MCADERLVCMCA